MLNRVKSGDQYLDRNLPIIMVLTIKRFHEFNICCCSLMQFTIYISGLATLSG